MGGEGALLDPGGTIVNTFTWEIGMYTNNHMEWLELMMGVDYHVANTMGKVNVLGNSLFIIRSAGKV